MTGNTEQTTEEGQVVIEIILVEDGLETEEQEKRENE
jgi:hypothetical protein